MRYREGAGAVKDVDVCEGAKGEVIRSSAQESREVDVSSPSLTRRRQAQPPSLKMRRDLSIESCRG
jgi:hypothetical protein